MPRKTIYIFIISFLILPMISSCREEIIVPGNQAGNLNQPVRLKSGSSYTFIINAENFSTTVHDYSGIESIHSKLLLALDDYSQGSVNFYIYEYSSRLVYQKVMSDNINPITAYLEGISPDIIHLTFYNFTGKLKVQVFTN